MKKLKFSRKTRKKLKKFMDFDKNKKILYNNIYLDEYKVVIKLPMNLKENPQEKIRIEKFDLAKYVYLFAYN
ncbi:MAG: hypothetical protein EU540_00905 [Promethearchaeota archaeon]|nr:MAG: hypothetical protein EU540_00905 [Candidatus Lokiarchaeota archaeon]